jgi:hypothetical protein
MIHWAVPQMFCNTRDFGLIPGRFCTGAFVPKQTENLSMKLFNRISLLNAYTLGTSDFDAEMSGIKFWKGHENLGTVIKNSFWKSGCLHFGLFSS